MYNWASPKLFYTGSILFIYSSVSVPAYHKVRKYKESHMQCMSLVGIGTLPTPFSPASVPFPPEPAGRGHSHSPLRMRGWGSPNSDDGRKSLALCLLCAVYPLLLNLIRWTYTVFSLSSLTHFSSFAILFFLSLHFFHSPSLSRYHFHPLVIPFNTSPSFQALEKAYMKIFSLYFSRSLLSVHFLKAFCHFRVIFVSIFPKCRRNIPISSPSLQPPLYVFSSIFSWFLSSSLFSALGTLQMTLPLLQITLWQRELKWGTGQVFCDFPIFWKVAGLYHCSTIVNENTEESSYILPHIQLQWYIPTL